MLLMHSVLEGLREKASSVPVSNTCCRELRWQCCLDRGSKALVGLLSSKILGAQCWQAASRPASAQVLQRFQLYTSKPFETTAKTFCQHNVYFFVPFVPFCSVDDFPIQLMSKAVHQVQEFRAKPCWQLAPLLIQMRKLVTRLLC